MNFRQTTSFAALLLMTGAAVAQVTPRVTTIQNNGNPVNRYDFVILADGYTAAEESKFNADAKAAVSTLFAIEPFKTYRSYFNAHTVFRASKESGANHPDRNPPVKRETAYGSYYNYGGDPNALFVNDIRLAARDDALAPDSEGRIIVLVNDSRIGHANGPSFNVINRTGMKFIAYHLGFSMGLLGDENEGTGSKNYTGPEPVFSNITKDSAGKKWAHWKGVGGVGAFAGAMGHKTGLYRPTADSMMRTPGLPFDVLAVEQLIKRTYVVVDAIENPSPAAKVVNVYRPAKQTFTFLNLVPGSSDLKWFLNGKPLATAGGSFILDSTKFTDGKYALQVSVQDTTTSVRSDPTKLLQSLRTWDVEVGNPPRPDLVAGAITVTPGTGTVNSGSVITIDSKITNPTASLAGRFNVEFFLSQDSKIDTTDIFLGSTTVAGLDKLGSQPVKLSAVVPFYVDAGAYYVGMWADRINEVLEHDTVNNVSKRTYAILGPKGCVTTLEYADALQSSSVRDNISITQGGQGNLRLTAPCLKNHWYVILWSMSGTSPGTKLNNGHVLPLNFDAAMMFGLSNLNHAPFHGFLGKVDARGHGTAYVHLPPGLNLPVINSSHFAACFIEPTISGNFTGVTGTVLQIFSR